MKHVAVARRRRVFVAAAVAVVASLAFAALGGIGLAGSAISLAQYQYGKKVTLCHKGKNTITVSAKAVPAHLRHGDKLGPCATGHKPNHGKHKGNTHHAPNPGSGTGASSQSGTNHGNGGGGGNGNGKGKGH
jgi:uncharacterized membrane protein YgcG